MKDVIHYLENQSQALNKKKGEKPSRLTNNKTTYEDLNPESSDLAPYLQVLEGVAK